MPLLWQALFEAVAALHICLFQATNFSSWKEMVSICLKVNWRPSQAGCNLRGDEKCISFKSAKVGWEENGEEIQSQYVITFKGMAGALSA